MAIVDLQKSNKVYKALCLQTKEFSMHALNALETHDTKPTNQCVFLHGLATWLLRVSVTATIKVTENKEQFTNRVTVPCQLLFASLALSASGTCQ